MQEIYAYDKELKSKGLFVPPNTLGPPPQITLFFILGEC